jgi:hypothetical protein
MAKKPGYGSLRVNEKKLAPSHPDFTGGVILLEDVKAGEEVKLSAWHNDYKGINLKHNTWKPDGQAKQEYPRPVSRDDNEVPF